MTIRRNVDFILKTKGMTKMELAEKMKTTPQSISQYLDSPNIGLEAIVKFARALRVTPADLVASPPLSYWNPPSGDEMPKDEQPHEPTKTTLFCPSCGKKILLTAEVQ